MKPPKIYSLPFNDTSVKLPQQKIEQHLASITKRFLMGKSNAISIYHEMIGSGQLILLKSEKLRSQLTSLKGNMQLLAVYEDEQLNFVDNHLSPHLNEYTDCLSANQKAISDSYEILLALNLEQIPVHPFSEN